MIRKNEDLAKMSDDEFDSIVKPFDDKLTEYVENNILHQYVAYYIATAYKMDALWDNKFNLTVYSALDQLAQFTDKNCDMDKIKFILKNEYKLKVVSDDPTNIEEIR